MLEVHTKQKRFMGQFNVSIDWVLKPIENFVPGETYIAHDVGTTDPTY